jgi:hypothetical protein
MVGQFLEELRNEWQDLASYANNWEKACQAEETSSAKILRQGKWQKSALPRSFTV